MTLKLTTVVKCKSLYFFAFYTKFLFLYGSKKKCYLGSLKSNQNSVVFIYFKDFLSLVYNILTPFGINPLTVPKNTMCIRKVNIVNNSVLWHFYYRHKIRLYEIALQNNQIQFLRAAFFLETVKNAKVFWVLIYL